MKAIVANVFFGGIFGCLSYANSTLATPVKSESIYSKQIMPAQLSTRATRSNVPVIPQLFDLIDNVLPTARLPSGDNAVNSSLNKGYNQWLEHTMSSSFSLPLQTNYFFPQLSLETNCGLAFCDNHSEQSGRLLSSPQQADLHKSYQGDLVLGLQKTFWPSENQHQYWGVTTVQHWRQNEQQSEQQSNSASLNYNDSSPILALGSSTLTFSGGLNDNLAKSAILEQGFNAAQEFKDFRGGIAYHHGITQQLTMGAGLVYENTLAGFTQLTYNSDILPIKTTISVLAKESGIDFYSHIRFQPTPNFVANYYRDAEKQKFDLNWSVYNGLTLIATGNSKTKSYSTGVKITLNNNHLSLHATAALDNEQNLRLQLNSKIGRLKLTYNSNQDQSNLELRGQLLDLDNLGIQCSAFVKYQTLGKKQQEFMVWGANIHSQAQVSQNKHQWEFELGYGTSSDDQGWMANVTIALQPDLLLKLGYQEISAVSDETKIKLQLSSN